MRPRTCRKWGATLTEISRVLKPGGVVPSLSLGRKVWLEWHVGLPCVHWLAPGSRARQCYSTLLRSIRFGFFKEDKAIGTWACGAMEWVDRWAHYRPPVGIDRAFARNFMAPSRLGSAWLERNFDRAPVVPGLPARFRQFAVTLLAGPDFEFEKPHAHVSQGQLIHHRREKTQ